MSELIEVKGLDELIKRMEKYPLELTKTMAVTMSAALNTLWENVPAYPPPPEGSHYRRTGTLGKSLGSGQGGGASEGNPSIYQIRKLGDNNFEGRFGTSLSYAPYVIGENTQAPIHAGRWWTIKTIAERSVEKINRLWQSAGDLLAKFLEGKGE